MFIVGDGEIISSEGTTQGDPIGIAVYALHVPAPFGFVALG